MTDAGAQIADTLTISSTIHGDRVWRRVGERPHVTRDGRHIVLATWETPCVICGKPFQISLPTGVRSIRQSKGFEAVTCPDHRMTTSEAARLRHRGKAALTAIKRRKLAASG